MALGKLDNYMRKNKTRPYTKIYSKWFKDLNVKLEAIKHKRKNIHGKKNIGKTFHDTSFSDAFSDSSPTAKKTKENINSLCNVHNPLLLKEMQIKTKMIYHLNQWEWPHMKKPDTASV